MIFFYREVNTVQRGRVECTVVFNCTVITPLGVQGLDMTCGTRQHKYPGSWSCSLIDCTSLTSLLICSLSLSLCRCLSLIVNHSQISLGVSACPAVRVCVCVRTYVCVCV